MCIFVSDREHAKDGAKIHLQTQICTVNLPNLTGENEHAEDGAKIHLWMQICTTNLPNLTGENEHAEDCDNVDVE